MNGMAWGWGEVGSSSGGSHSRKGMKVWCVLRLHAVDIRT